MQSIKFVIYAYFDYKGLIYDVTLIGIYLATIRNYHNNFMTIGVWISVYVQGTNV